MLSSQEQGRSKQRPYSRKEQGRSKQRPYSRKEGHAPALLLRVPSSRIGGIKDMIQWREIKAQRGRAIPSKTREARPYNDRASLVSSHSGHDRIFKRRMI